MLKNKEFVRKLAETAGWLSVLLFILGAISALINQDIILPGNDYWQGALYLILFAIFAQLTSRE